MSLAFLEKNNRDQEWILALSLGHNSSVVLAKSTGEIVTGYEEERLTKAKSDSSFPINALTKCLEKIAASAPKYKPVILNIGVSHWFNNNIQNSTWNRYYLDIEKFIEKFFDFRSTISIIKRVETSFNHHSLHLDSIRPFVEANISADQREKYSNKKTVVFVADGFGNQEEVMTLREYNDLNSYLKGDSDYKEYKLSNLNYSLGLMYQYVTSSVGMKENQDEYKFLGYESYIQTVASNKSLLDSKINELVGKFDAAYNLDNWQNLYDYDNAAASTHNTPINLDKLAKVKAFYHDFAKKAIAEFGIGDKLFSESYEKNPKRSQRILMGYILQQSVEKIVVNIFRNYTTDFCETHNILVVGGLFYNVKLNNRLMTSSKNLYCVMPLAGDQGCTIGILDNFLREQYHRKLKLEKLNFGSRAESNYQFSTDYIRTIANEIVSVNKMDVSAEQIEKIVEYTAKNTSFKVDVNEIYERLAADSGIVNLVYSGLEFGPRALCFTTSLARPTSKNVEIINDLNDRDTVMPMAPVMLKKNDTFFFDSKEVARVVGSDRYMILTYVYKNELNREVYGGVMHKVQGENFDTEIQYSGRPQFLYQRDDNQVVFDLLQNLDQKNDVKALINTSYNVHGTPIVYDAKDAVDNFVYQVVMKVYKNIDKELYLYVGL
jgi:predicted NodU family carbamoyl transferase